LLRLDESVLPGVLALSAGLFGLLSAWFFLPLVWFVTLFRASETETKTKPPFYLRLASPLALLNGAVLLVFLVAYVAAVILSLDGDNQFLLFFGLPGQMRLLFILPMISLILTLGMLALSLPGWFSSQWHIVRKLYYSLLTASAILVLFVLAFAGMLFGFFA
jgi:hypothetical protein